MHQQTYLPTELHFKLYSFFCFALILSLFASCGTDPLTEGPDNTEDPPKEIVITHTPDLYTGDISGKVLDENAEALAEVSVTIAGNETVTDENGFFNFQGIQLDAQGTIVRASKENYWSLSKVLVPSKEQKNQTRFMLLPNVDKATVESASGGMANFSDRVKIDFPANAFSKENGEAYEGAVEISAVHLDPNDENFGMLSPGDFRAFNADSELQTLMSLGMAGVELRGSNNETLELNEDVTTKLYIKVPDGSTIQEMPLWHFDEESGYWLEEGMAQREGDFYVGEVSHFSWWNCDVPFSTVKLSGSVLNTSGTGISGLPVTVFLADGMSNLGVEYTGDRGIFCGYVPIDRELIVQIKDECGNVIYEENIGSLDEDTHLGTILIGNQDVVELCGSILNCDGEPVANGYAVVRYNANSSFVPADATGNFCSAVPLCDATSFEIFGVDLDAQLQGNPSTFNLSDGPFSDLELTACDQVAYNFSYSINNGPATVLTDFNISSQDGMLIGFGTLEEVHGVFPAVLIDGRDWGTNDFQVVYWDVNIADSTNSIDCDAFTCGSLNLDVVEYGGLGEPIILNMTGTSFQGVDFSVSVSGILE